MTRVDPVAVLTAGRNINIVGLNLTKMATEITNELAGFAGMAGTDLAAKSFAQTYDPAVNALVEALGNLGEGAAKVGLILGTSAHNYNDANAAAAHKPPPDIGPMPDQPLGCPPTPNVPSAWGDPSPGPWWWDLIVSYAQSKLWPDGHQDQLRTSEGKLNSVGSWIYRQAELLWDGMGHLRGQDAEDIDAGYAVVSDIYQQLFTISENAKALAQMCADQARLIDETRSAIENAVAELGITTALIWAAGALLTPVTAGGSGYAAAGISAARLVQVGSRVAGIITRFEGASVAVAASGARVAPAMAGITTAAARVAALPVVRVSATGANAVRVGAEEQEALKRLAREKDYEAYVKGKQRKGEPYRSYDDYLQTRDNWDAIKKQSDEWEDYVRDRDGLTTENGWQPQKYAPNGFSPTQEGARRWDFANPDGQPPKAIECKSGQVDSATFNKQIGNDIKMVNEEGWRVTWHLRENLSPTQMRLLTQYKNETGGRFDFEVGP
ncbi:hypothetical protein MABM_22170 [Mycobacteroides abscessus]|uniref:Tox-REase-5 domain-containing protein n=1 Tax=Mycobacteroides abscessus subsp. bolletii 50594 TaxID=1303024 RepID=A0AB33A7A5_9MYCO|nr:hypothetical protein [Mycobacteroides abscessus]AGM27692.1 hypothetical protein MASS_1090 [Mycobacteroides abscessus subsp. bolletii 50594]BBZ82301.1 hypothetical protein MABM_22170 [Mycobacteroides abscessus]